MEISEAYNLIMGKLESWMDTAIEMLPNFIVAILVLIIFYATGKLLRKTIAGLLRRTTQNKTVINLFETITGILVIGLGFFIALGVLKLDGVVASLLAGAGIIGLALGFAFQDITSNFIAGVILSIRHPFGIGDIIESNGYYGTVEQLNLRTTIMRIPQGELVYIPNKLVFENPFENYTWNGDRRIDLECGVSYGDDLEKAKKVALEAIEEMVTYKKNRAVEFYYSEFGDSSINFVIRFWIDFRTNPDFWTARSNAIMAIAKKFAENDIMIPFPIRTLDFGIRGGEKLSSMLGNGKPEGAKEVS